MCTSLSLKCTSIISEELNKPEIELWILYFCNFTVNAKLSESMPIFNRAMLNFPFGEYDILPETISMVECGQVNPKDYYSHVVPFTDISRALDLITSREAFKVILDFDV